MLLAERRQICISHDVANEMTLFRCGDNDCNATITAFITGIVICSTQSQYVSEEDANNENNTKEMRDSE